MSNVPITDDDDADADGVTLLAALDAELGIRVRRMEKHIPLSWTNQYVQLIDGFDTALKEQLVGIDHDCDGDAT